MSAWPGDLPQDQFLGTSIQREMGMVRSEMDVGPAKTRRRYTACVTKVQCPIKLDNAQLAVFNEFYEETLLEGSEPFDWSNPHTDVTVSYRFIGPPNFRLIMGDLSGDDTTRLWEGTLSLEILP